MVKVGEVPRPSLNRLPINPSPRSQRSISMRPLPHLTSTRGGHEIPERGVSLFGSPGNKNLGKLGKNNRDRFSIDQ